jgi:hypothetical protein
MSKQTTKQPDIEASLVGFEKQRAALEAKREECQRHGVELAEERAAVSFAAHVDGDAIARARLDQLNIEIATHGSELASIDAALQASADRLDEARRAAAAKSDEENRAALVARLELYVEHWQADAICLEELKEAMQRRRALLPEIHGLQRALGMPPYPSVEMDGVFGSLQFRNVTSEIYGHLIERLDSSERRSVAAWPNNVLASAARLRNPKEAA